MLSKKTAETGQPSALISADGKRFSLVLPDKKSRLCPSGKSTAIRVITSPLELGKPGAELSYCYVQ